MKPLRSFLHLSFLLGASGFVCLYRYRGTWRISGWTGGFVHIRFLVRRWGACKNNDDIFIILCVVKSYWSQLNLKQIFTWEHEKKTDSLRPCPLSWYRGNCQWSTSKLFYWHLTRATQQSTVNIFRFFSSSSQPKTNLDCSQSVKSQDRIQTLIVLLKKVF